MRLLRWATAAAVLGAGAFAVLGSSSTAAGLGLALLGFALAPIFPALMAETPRRVGMQLAPHAVGFQVSAATVGVALLPNLAGLIGERLGLAAVPVFFALCSVGLGVLHHRLAQATPQH